MNIKPSILVSNYNTALILWVGVSLNGHYYDRVVHRSRYNSGNWSSTFTKLGSYVEMVNGNTSDAHNKIVYSWVEDNTYPVNKFRATDVSGTQLLNTSGNYVQVSNGSSLNNIYTMAFRKESSPYYFKLSNSMGSYAKTNDNKYVGREGIVRNEEVEYTCTLSDVDVDGKRIDFVEIDEMAPAKSVEKLYSDLETVPFEVNDLSDFTFNISYGITNTEKAEKVLSEKHSVKYIVELVDAKSGKVLNELDEIVFDENNVEKQGEKSYKVDTKGLGKRSLKLRLTVKTDLKVQTTTATIESEENVLAKQAVENIKNVTAERVPVTDYALFQNYPNPFNPTTTITYQIPKEGKVTIKVYDSIGKEITTLVNEEKQRGRYNVTFDASNLTSGIYFYSLSSGNFKETKKLILLK